ncbi:hypothetical protein H696_00194 [Fonticula alba]|uniref:RNA helicase n=1 Tax=Fonticula alba TaxID=691883 RepID=A0A058ZDY4_FONAL|nr:hypothetical protein H696_00194 [Fonticula alba]KCV72610.1 hypothetical protein H696_00194 [Fonticula alba]|eukprot:XP_009492311.1 hypothetical protein H696_00194 [Fonticula alba]
MSAPPHPGKNLSVQQVCDMVHHLNINPESLHRAGIDGEKLLGMNPDVLVHDFGYAPPEADAILRTFHNPEHERRERRPMRPRNPEGQQPTRGIVQGTEEDADQLFADSGDASIASFQNMPVNCTGENIPAPISGFDQADFPAGLYENVVRSRYTQPSPVQAHAIPVIVAGRDLMACAQTGSGKTAAFLLPIISLLMKQDPLPAPKDPRSRAVRPQAIVVSPTRELACQIFDSCRKYTYKTPIRPCVVYGGVHHELQIEQMTKYGADVLIATPGRLLHLLETPGLLDMSFVRFLVLDEADRLLHFGFGDQVNQLLNYLDPDFVRVMMFSATFPPAIQQLAQRILSQDYVFLSVGRVGSMASSIDHVVDYVEESDKHAELVNHLRDLPPNHLVIVFVQTRIQSDSLMNYLLQLGFPTTTLHADMSQYHREYELNEFLTRRKSILVATDVASRGLDIPNVTTVINFDMPATIDDYTHRVGRTGRVGRKGLAISFFNDADTALAGPLLDALMEVGAPIPEWLEALALENRGHGGQSRYRRGGNHHIDRDIRGPAASGGGGAAPRAGGAGVSHQMPAASAPAASGSSAQAAPVSATPATYESMNRSQETYSSWDI